MTNFILYYRERIPALTDWSLHSSSKDEKRFCFKHGKNCSLMGKMPPLIKVELSNEEEDNERDDLSSKRRKIDFDVETL